MSKRGFLNRLFSSLVSRLKKREYLIDEHITGAELMGTVWERGIMLLRGFFKKCWFKQSGKIFFCGKHCVLRSKRKISVGNGVTIHQGCRINALSKKGIIKINGSEYKPAAIGENGQIIYKK